MTTQSLDITTSITSSTSDIGPVQRFVDSIASGQGIPTGLFADDIVLDATVPNWRYSTVGEQAVRLELAKWYRHPTSIERITMRIFGGGEAVEVDLSWVEAGVPHAAHQVHVLQLSGSRITADTVFCGGRWPAALLAEMEAARAH